MKILTVLLTLLLFNINTFADELLINYQLLDRIEFEKTVVGNTVVGITRPSSSLYMLHFLPDGICRLWKRNKIYEGTWWFETDSQSRDMVRAYWPNYISSDPQSLFSPKNPKFGTATAVRYYRDPQNSTSILISGKTFACTALLIPGCAFPTFAN